MLGNKEHDRLIKEISSKYNIDKRVVNFIVGHSFVFTHNKIKDNEDWRPIMLRYVGKFAPIKSRLTTSKTI